jgi:hypothetical protein
VEKRQVGQIFMMHLLLILLSADFPITTEVESQRYPAVSYQEGQYYVFWADRRFLGVDSTSCLYAARVSTDGAVLDTAGKLLFRDDVGYELDAAFDGANFLVVFRNHC